MKKVKYLAMLLAAGMFAACSDNLEDTGAGNAGGTTPVTGEGYVKVAINMPTTSGGMSRTNDESTSPIDLEDGLDNEFKVNAGIIVFFEAAKKTSTNPDLDADADAKFSCAYSLSSLAQAGNDPSQVSSIVTTTTTAPLVDENTQLYALVILNPNERITVSEDGKLQIDGGDFFAENKKLTALQTKLALTVDQVTKASSSETKRESFLMISSPLSTVAGSDNMKDATAKTLVPVTVYETREEAEGHDAARIYVERIVAKVTLKGNFKASGEDKYTMNVAEKDNASVYNGDHVALQGWVLNVTNNTTNLLRDVSGFNTTDGWLTGTYGKISRFAGTSVIPIDYSGEAISNYYRIYWAKDHNYTGTYENTDAARVEFNIWKDADEIGGSGSSNIPWNEDIEHTEDEKEISSPLYCLENTMDYNAQTENQTTTVLLKTKYYSKIGNETTASLETFFICGTDPKKYRWEDQTDENAVKGLKSTIVEEANKRITTEANKLTAEMLGLNSEAKNGMYDSLEDIKNLFTLTTIDPTVKEEQYAAIWNAMGTIKYYLNGTSYYYAALIKHFAEDEVKWENGEDYDQSHLGRYGVVRNNWYEINITGISGPGDPSIIEPGDEDDDKKEGYVRAEINVLSWAKRTQNVDL